MVSIIIINFNTYDLTCRCIESIYKKTVNIEYEIILVDNNSSECSPDLFLIKFPLISIIKSTENVGFARGNNLGIAHAKGDFILLLNSDTELLNNAIKIGVNILRQNMSIGCLSGKLVYPNGSTQGVAGRFPSLSLNLLELFRINKILSRRKLSYNLLGDNWDYNLDVDADWIWGTFFLIPMKIIKSFPNGKLHDDFFMYYEDVLWCFFIRKKLNLRVYYTSKPLILHHLNGSSSCKDSTRNYRIKILPNEIAFVKGQRGWLYGFFYYLTLAAHHLTLRKRENINTCIFYLGIIKSYFLR